MASASVPSTAAVPPTAPPPLEGEAIDRGVVRRDALRVRHWDLLGSAKITGDVMVEEADVRGFATVHGALLADRLTIDGTLEVDGPLTVMGALSVRGRLRPGAAAAAGSLSLDGELDAAGAVEVAGDLLGQGHFRAAGPVQARRIDLQGRFEGQQAQTAGEFRLGLQADSSLTALRADRVHVRRLGPPLRSAGVLECERIEATEVDLESVRCRFLRAERITLRAGCRIRTAIGTLVERHAGADIGPRSVSAPPHGLWR